MHRSSMPDEFLQLEEREDDPHLEEVDDKAQGSQTERPFRFDPRSSGLGGTGTSSCPCGGILTARID